MGILIRDQMVYGSAPFLSLTPWRGFKSQNMGIFLVFTPYVPAERWAWTSPRQLREYDMGIDRELTSEHFHFSVFNVPRLVNIGT